MSSLTELFAIRSRIDPVRQPHYRNHYSSLHKFLQDRAVTDPFSWEGADDDFWDNLLKNPLFVSGSDGAEIKDRPRDSQYCYRITSVSKLVKFSTEGRLTRGAVDKDNWDTVNNDYLVRKDWMALKGFVQGELGGPRGFTWWTPHDFLPDPYQASHRIGLVDEWIPANALLLRCHSDDLLASKAAKRPTIVDAFDAPIFFATMDSASPPTGLSIDLEANPLCVEQCEVVCSRIPVDKIECLPIPLVIPLLPDRKFTMAHCAMPLHAFYTSLEGE